MKIAPAGPFDIPNAAAIDPASSPAVSRTPTTAATPRPVTPLQSEVMTPALDALAAMPDIDEAKVAAVREALIKGEINFDAGKLAGLISRFHGGQ